jgi:predicted AAA+ superfamily ATPase
MIYRDLTERFSVKNPPLIKYLLKYMLQNIANPLSIHKVYNDLRSQGFQIGKNTVYEYIRYLEEAFVLFRTERWSRSVRQQAVNPIKMYTIDVAFRRAMSTHTDIGRIFENVVFLHLRRSGLIPYYFMDRQEIDFYGSNYRLINACYSLEDITTRQREITGLTEAMQALDHRESWLITWEEEETFQKEGKTIHIQPLWKWLLIDIESDLT